MSGWGIWFDGRLSYCVCVSVLAMSVRVIVYDGLREYTIILCFSHSIEICIPKLIMYSYNHVDSLVSHHGRNSIYPGVIFFGDPIECSVTSDGGTIPDASINAFIRVRVPQGAVPEGCDCNFTLRPCLSVPFVLPNGYEFKSPIFLIECDSKLESEVQIMMEHYADLKMKLIANKCSLFMLILSLPTTRKVANTLSVLAQIMVSFQ